MDFNPEVLKKRFERDGRLGGEDRIAVLRRVRRRMKTARKANMTFSDLLEEEIQRKMRAAARSSNSMAASPLEARLTLKKHLRGFSDTPEESEVLQALDILKGASDKETTDLLYALSDVSGFRSVRMAATEMLRPRC